MKPICILVQLLHLLTTFNNYSAHGSDGDTCNEDQHNCEYTKFEWKIKKKILKSQWHSASENYAFYSQTFKVPITKDTNIDFFLYCYPNGNQFRDFMAFYLAIDEWSHNKLTSFTFDFYFTIKQLNYTTQVINYEKDISTQFQGTWLTFDADGQIERLEHWHSSTINDLGTGLTVDFGINIKQHLLNQDYFDSPSPPSNVINLEWNVSNSFISNIWRKGDAVAIDARYVSGLFNISNAIEPWLENNNHMLWFLSILPNKPNKDFKILFLTITNLFETNIEYLNISYLITIPQLNYRSIFYINDIQFNRTRTINIGLNDDTLIYSLQKYSKGLKKRSISSKSSNKKYMKKSVQFNFQLRIDDIKYKNDQYINTKENSCSLSENMDFISYDTWMEMQNADWNEMFALFGSRSIIPVDDCPVVFSSYIMPLYGSHDESILVIQPVFTQNDWIKTVDFVNVSVFEMIPELQWTFQGENVQMRHQMAWMAGENDSQQLRFRLMNTPKSIAKTGFSVYIKLLVHSVVLKDGSVRDFSRL